MDVAAEGDVIWATPAGRHRDDEDDRHRGGGAQAEIGALLSPQLAQLPAVDRSDPGHQAASPIAAGSGVDRGFGIPTLGEAKEEILQRGLVPGEFEHQSARLAQREGQFADRG